MEFCDTGDKLKNTPQTRYSRVVADGGLFHRMKADGISVMKLGRLPSEGTSNKKDVKTEIGAGTAWEAVLQWQGGLRFISRSGRPHGRQSPRRGR